MAHEPEAAGGAGEVGNGAAPSMNILAQYMKDMSFENPNAPQSLHSQETQPQIDISVNVNARTLAPTDYEVELKRADGQHEEGLGAERALLAEHPRQDHHIG